MNIFRPERRVKGEMRVLLDVMRHDIDPKEVKRTLDSVQAEKEVDPSAGIFIAKLAHEAVEFDGHPYEFYGARVLAKTGAGNQPFVSPHLHRGQLDEKGARKAGDEAYFFFSDGGEMNLGNVEANERGPYVVYPKATSKMKVKKGDEIVIQAGQVHTFRNIGKGPADFVFACPPGHLDNDVDRRMVGDLPGGIPPHFKK